MISLISAANRNLSQVELCKEIITRLIEHKSFQCSAFCKYYDIMRKDHKPCPYNKNPEDRFACAEALIETEKERVV